MRGRVESGRLVTLIPVDPENVDVNDVVFVRWKGNHLLHLVKAVEGDQVLIGNNRGKVNGWVPMPDIVAKMTDVENEANSQGRHIWRVTCEPRHTVREMNDRTYTQIAAAFVRGMHAQGFSIPLPSSLLEPSLNELSDAEFEDIYVAGRQAGLRLHKFKRTMELPRVRRVFGVLRQIAPSDLLDIGSGRGVFLWPLLDEFPQLPVTATDRDERRAEDLEAVRLGGVEQLTAHQMDVLQIAFDEDSFDTVTMLEALEHLTEPHKALAEVIRVARRIVVLSVPFKARRQPSAHQPLFRG